MTLCPNPRLPRVALIALAVLAASVSATHAQQGACTFPWQGNQTSNGCEVPPELRTWPDGNLTTSQPSVPWLVHARDFDGGLVDTTFHVKVNGVRQTGMWTQSFTLPDYNGWMNTEFWQRVEVPLSPAAPTVPVSARVCDVHHYLGPPFCPEENATFTLSVPEVEVTPNGAELLSIRGPSRHANMTVANRGTVQATYALTAECRDENRLPVSPCSVTSTVTLAPGGSASVPVTFWADRAGAVVWIKLNAHQQGSPVISDAGWVDVTVLGASGGSGAAPLAQVADLNSGTTVVRSQCVTVAAGPGAAYECGDLRLAHAMPAVRWRGRVRPAVLLYNSQHADPLPTVFANVTAPEGTLRPDSMHLTVRMNGVVMARKSYRGVDFAPGTMRRVAVAWSARTTPTGVYPYQLEVTSRFGTVTHSTTVPGELVIINRRTSPFGAGWWLAGLEQVVTPANDPSTRLWIGGDGSTRLYRLVPGRTDTWLADAVDRPEYLYFESNGYVRPLPGGGIVRFYSDGRHYYTRNPLNQSTFFTYDASLRVQDVTVAYTGAGTAPHYTFRYDAQGRLDLVDANIPGQADSVRFIQDGVRRVTSITDPDGIATGLQYTSTGRPYSPTVRVDRRGTPVSYTYGQGGRLTSVRVVPDPARPDTIVTAFDAAESKGITSAYAPSQVHTRLNGPRTDILDVTYLYPGRWGAPERIRDALGNETLIERTAAFPALATAVTTPGGRRSSAVYDTLGRVRFQVVHNPFGDGLNDTTRYEYDDRWNAVTRVSRQRGPGGQVLLEDMAIAYDTVGNRLWVQQGDDPARRVHFTYYPLYQYGTGQVRTVSTPTAAGMAVDSVAYDTMHNPVLTRSPMGFLTRMENDAAGRPTLVVSPTDSAAALTLAGLNATGVRRHVLYDALGRDTLSWTTAPPMGGAPAQTAYVRTRYDDAGAVTHVSRWSAPDTAGIGVVTTVYGYDRAGRKVREQDPVQTQLFGYDPAGNATTWTTGRGHVITTRYDALGRVVRRAVPAVSYGGTCYAGPTDPSQPDTIVGPPPDSMEHPESMETPSSSGTCIPFPYYPNATEGGLTIPEEWTYFRYDAAGNMVSAENRDAVVSRTYYPNGALRTDHTAMRSFKGFSFSGHQYQVGYGYDRLGRVDSILHPANLTEGTLQYDRYQYNAATGALELVTDRENLQFSFLYDPSGRMTHSYGPGGLAEGVTYDLDGRRRTRQEQTAYEVLHQETFRHDARGKLLSAWNGASEFQQWYSGLGMLTYTDWMNHGSNHARVIEEYEMDALGNAVWRRSGESLNRAALPAFITDYQPGTGQVVRIEKKAPPSSNGGYPDVTTRSYDGSGNMVYGVHTVHGTIGSSSYAGPVRVTTSRSYYAADQRLRYFQESDVSIASGAEFRGVWEEYRYDPLGRRILVHSNRNDLCNGPAAECVSHVTRMVWSGDQLLWEMRARAGVTDDPDAESSGGEMHGVVSYTHATGIDRPLVIHKRNHPAIIPHENWRGQFARGTYANGQVSDCPDSNSTGCVPLAWPGRRTTAWHRESEEPDVVTWYGGLVDGMRDASGQMYMRNRYYDPATGQFTQPDPIGLAGGLNSYGFAAGDPVSYSDPYGLKVCADRGMQRRIEQTYRMEIGWDSNGCVDENSTLRRLASSGSHAELQDQFIHVVNSGLNLEVRWRDGGGSFFKGPANLWDDADIGIDWRQAHRPYGIERNGGCARVAPWGVHALIAHEFGHAYHFLKHGDGQVQAPAIRSENLLNGALGRPARSERCHP